MEKLQIGVVGVGVMGKSLALNFESKGYSVALYDISKGKVDETIEENRGKNLVGTHIVEEFVNSLESPRKILLMVNAGEITDKAIDSLVPHLDKGDILIDGGNTYFVDTIRRNKRLAEEGINFIGAGVSGGEEGALKGPSIMPGGQKDAYEKVKDMLENISAKVNNEPCCSYIGPNGAGHYVKMVHNGIEYGDMQLICEAYFFLKQTLDLTAEEFHEIFAEWNKGELNSYLIEITADIFKKKDEETGKPLVDVILDTAGQKGTGKWTSQSALDLGISLPIITESVFARCISALKEERVNASKVLSGPKDKIAIGVEKAELIEAVRQALYMSKICSYAQGFTQLKAASEEYDWNLDFGSISMLWRGGCIIRAAFLQNIKEAYETNTDLPNLLLDPYFKEIVESYQGGLRQIISMAVQQGIPIPAFSAAISYYDSYRTAKLPANLLQAQRDYFGAHTYKRVDKEGTFHTKWI
ncbi:6-phosphogluconate dehydrogenase, decarboxylating [Bacillus cereus]|uniref:NADP-dependent phosphogluconate dehydrogenase n=1 Tax=Bacillus cereus TaxID=1396 RepID=UPI001EEDB1B6|nr:NADP-dependent phosphogluconate dehydrogenase [Bacillus cereus]MCU5715593.1 NADP-dependent phosphogluconate dehydrogenase [Bacillus cereus]MDA1845030.1 NADP-dependent phosphogluconate dehydrogenase [Bacillus cereus]BCB35261.1 6-phosphogluconate dehydrogenase, decarboxylating [Bacillus cereus]BCB98073.1 6-phosphogluconate dehydrogenase, decarboxylating [Bacillus cereus]BCC21563.1 6-phosphogluconate dehydrogenase, decarboxylating [Bacillus cereus]